MNITIIEHLKTIGSLISSSLFSIIALVIMFIIMILFMTTEKSNQRQSKKIYILIYVALIVTLLVEYHSSLTSMMDYLINHVFVLIYFPNLAVYLIAIIISNVVMWRSMFNGKTDSKIKIINSVCFSILHYFLVILLQLIMTEKLDVFSEISVYSNPQAVSLLELSSAVFVVWMLFLILYKGIQNYLKKRISKMSIVTEESKESTLPVLTLTVDQQNQPEVPTFTLEEYRLMSKILKEEKQKETEKPEESKLSELEKLYQSLD